MAKRISKRRFDIYSIGTRTSGSILFREVSWWADLDEVVLGTVALDLSDRTYGWMILIRDEAARFRCADNKMNDRHSTWPLTNVSQQPTFGLTVKWFPYYNKSLVDVGLHKIVEGGLVRRVHSILEVAIATISKSSIIVTVLMGKLKTAPRQAHCIFCFLSTLWITPMVLKPITTMVVIFVTRGLKLIR